MNCSVNWMWAWTPSPQFPLCNLFRKGWVGEWRSLSVPAPVITPSSSHENPPVIITHTYELILDAIWSSTGEETVSAPLCEHNWTYRVLRFTAIVLHRKSSRKGVRWEHELQDKLARNQPQNVAWNTVTGSLKLKDRPLKTATQVLQLFQLENTQQWQKCWTNEQSAGEQERPPVIACVIISVSSYLFAIIS